MQRFMTHIISGASGFVGENLTKYLTENEQEVLKLSLRNENWKEFFNANENADSVIHLAGIAHDTSNTLDDDIYFKVNRDLTIELFEEFIKSDIKKFIFFSSVKAAADTLERVLTEKFIPNPLTPYGKSKLEAENYLLSKELSEDKKVYIVRPCMIHGPGNKGNLNLLYQVVKKRIPWPLASYHNERSFLSIDNLNYLMWELLNNNDIESGIYNFADDKALSTNEIVVLISESLNKKPILWKIPTKMMEFIAKIGDKISLPLNSERLKKLTENYLVSNHKIKKALNIDNLPTSAKQGMIKTLDSFK